jgi:L-threonylcarbamoyladenylate synthase
LSEEKQLNNPSWLARAVETVRAGEVVALPYERLFGLAAHALDKEAVARVAAIKGRAEYAVDSKPISVILPDMDALSKVAADVSPLAYDLARNYWPGPLTIIVKAAVGLPLPLVSESGTIGVRIAGPSPAAELALRSGLVLTATSANLKDAHDAISSDEVKRLQGLSMVLDGVVAGPPGSTVVDATGEQLRVLREGYVNVDVT